MTIEMRVPKTFFCPRCDRPFTSLKSNLVAKAAMIAHLKKAHKDYYDTMYKD